MFVLLTVLKFCHTYKSLPYIDYPSVAQQVPEVIAVVAAWSLYITLLDHMLQNWQQKNQRKVPYVPKRNRKWQIASAKMWELFFRLDWNIGFISRNTGTRSANQKGAKFKTRHKGGNARRWAARQRSQRAHDLKQKIKYTDATNVQRKKLQKQEKQMQRLVAAHTVVMTATGNRKRSSQAFDTDSRTMAIDNCCSKCITNCKTDIIEPPTKVRTKVTGVGGEIQVTLRGTVRWAIEDDHGVQHYQTIPGTYYNPDAPYRLYSPQHVAQAMNDHSPKPHGTWWATYDDSVVLQWDQRRFTRTVKLDPETNVALIRSASGYGKFIAFCQEISEIHDDPAEAVKAVHAEGTTGAEILNQAPPERRHPDLPDSAFDGRTKETNIENDDVEVPSDDGSTELMAWHYRLGHLSFKKIKSMAARGDLPGHLARLETPKCAACLYGKMTRRPWRNKAATGQSQTPSAPGDVIAVDQLVSPKLGLIAQMKGFITQKRYKAVTVFVDCHSNLSFVYFQKTVSAAETIEGKRAFERYARSHGVVPKHYHADNGIFETEAFNQAVQELGQTISYAAVNAHHQNGKAEKKIRDLQDMARTMLLHAVHRWPDAITANLWPYAIRMASETINIAPKAKTNISPLELFSQSDVAPRVKHSHTFGAPVYVLDQRLQQAGGKIHKWSEKSRMGIYLGSSPRHSRKVALVLNLQTGHVSPQFHVSVDDYFETVKAEAGNWLPKSR